MIVTYKTFENLKYPVYMVEDGMWDSVDGLLMLNDRIVDDTNMPGSTLGLRRLQTHTAIEDLVPLKKALQSSIGLIKNKPHNYIDSAGKPFKYIKTKMFDLRYYKIKQVLKCETYSTIKMYGIKRQFTLLRPPEPGRFWVGILFIGRFPWLLYDFSIDHQPNTKRKA